MGSPPPKYTWVDKEGIDATEKEGTFMQSKAARTWIGIKKECIFKIQNEIIKPKILMLFHFLNVLGNLKVLNSFFFKEYNF